MPKTPQLKLSWSPSFQSEARQIFARLRGYTIPHSKLAEARHLVHHWLCPVYSEAEALERLLTLECDLYMLGAQPAPQLADAVTAVRDLFPHAALVAYGQP